MPKAAKHPNAGKVFLDYLLSKRGQELVAKAALFSIRDDVQGETTSASLQKELGQVLKPIPVGPDILDSLNQKKRLDFLDRESSVRVEDRVDAGHLLGRHASRQR